jgi:hypothetical protein
VWDVIHNIFGSVVYFQNVVHIQYIPGNRQYRTYITITVSSGFISACGPYEYTCKVNKLSINSMEQVIIKQLTAA